MKTPPIELGLSAVALAKAEPVVDDLREIVALVEKQEGLTTDYADDMDGKGRERKHPCNPCNPW